MAWDVNWTMTDERAFLDKLGTHRDSLTRGGDVRALSPEARAKLLRGYLAGLKLRRAFTSLMEADCRAHAEHLLAEASGDPA